MIRWERRGVNPTLGVRSFPMKEEEMRYIIMLILMLAGGVLMFSFDVTRVFGAILLIGFIMGLAGGIWFLPYLLRSRPKHEQNCR